MNRSFYVHEHRQGRLMQRSVDAALKFLIASDMILEIGEHLGSTEFGTLVSRLYIDPRSAALIVSTLRKRTDYADIGLLHLICSTPDMPKLYVRNTDRPALDRMLETNEPDLWLPMPAEEEEMEGYYRALKTAMLLSDWTDEMPDAKICERYSVGPGDIYGMVESVNWLLHASQELSRMFAPGFNQAVRYRPGPCTAPLQQWHYLPGSSTISRDRDRDKDYRKRDCRTDICPAGACRKIPCPAIG